ncbi:MAG: insulinase family protein [Desulfuromonadaceae bacterium]|nr:insulinase family protein [Desulfuromonadaceae bacterium]
MRRLFCGGVYSVLLLVMAIPFLAGAAEAEKRPDDLVFSPLSWEMVLPKRLDLKRADGLEIPVYFQRDNELPLVDLTLLVGVGNVADPAGKSGLSELVAQLLRSGGSRHLRAAEVDRELERLAADLSVESGPYTIQLHLSVLAEELPRALELLFALLEQPAFETERFELAREQLLEQVRRRIEQPGALANQLMMRRLYACHPLGHPPTVATVSALTREDVQAFHARYFGPANVRIAVSGDVEATQLRQLLAAQLEPWQQVAQTVAVPELTGSLVAGTVVIDRPLPQTTILLTERGIKIDNPDLYAVQVMNYILGGGGFNSRLMREIRSNRGLAYSVYSWFSVGRRLPGPFVAGCETKNASVAQVLELFQQAMERMREEPVSEEDLALAKQSQINSFVFTFANVQQLVERVMVQDHFAYPADYLQRYRERIAAVTAEDVQRVARRYLHPRQQLTILVGQRNEIVLPETMAAQTVEAVAAETLL